MNNCPVDGCEARIDSAYLMCRYHWYSVTKPLRDRVWRTFNGGAGLFDDAYLDARDAAIAAANRNAARARV